MELVFFKYASFPFAYFAKYWALQIWLLGQQKCCRTKDHDAWNALKYSKIFIEMENVAQSWPFFLGYFYWNLQKHSTWDNVVENLIQQLVFLPQEILQCWGRKSILMKDLVSLCLKPEKPNNDEVRLKL